MSKRPTTLNRRWLPVILALIALFAVVPLALAGTTNFSGEFDTSSPTFLRPNSGCTSGVQTAYYATQEFNVSAAGEYTVETTDANLAPSDWGPQDTFLLLYEGSFDPSNSTANCIAGNDDIDFDNDNVLSRIVKTLQPGHYIAVITTFDGSAVGSYAGFISGAGDISLGTAEPTTPEPTTPEPPILAVSAPSTPDLAVPTPEPSAQATPEWQGWNPTDNRINPQPSAPAAVYLEGDSLLVYALNSEGSAYLAMDASTADVLAACSPAPTENTLLSASDDDRVRLYCLTTGEIQLNLNYTGEEIVYIWDTLPPTTQTTYSFDGYGNLLSYHSDQTNLHAGKS